MEKTGAGMRLSSFPNAVHNGPMTEEETEILAWGLPVFPQCNGPLKEEETDTGMGLTCFQMLWPTDRGRDEDTGMRLTLPIFQMRM